MTCYVYVLPCVVEDFLKLGFSRDPAARFDAFHARYFEVFDLRRGWLIEVESEKEARALELKLRRPLAAHRAPAPLTVRWEAGGHTEWLRGAHEHLWDVTQGLLAVGYTVHFPVCTWMHRALLERCDKLYEWGSLAEPEMDASDEPWASPALKKLGNALDACEAVGIDIRPWVSERVVAWHAEHSRGRQPSGAAPFGSVWSVDS